MASSLKENIKNSGLLDKLIINQKKYAGIKESKSLISIYEKHIFVWHDSGSCILTSEVNDLKVNGTTCKTLTFTNPPVFDVECMLFNQTGSLLALNGRNGVMVFEVPWRYGKFGTSNSEENITGRSWNIAEYFFVCSNRVSVVQIAWHPGSASNTHLTVLSTDNYLRTYDVTDPQTPLQVISLSINTSSNSFLSAESKMSFSNCLGENAVSFDFGPPERLQVFSRGSKVSVEEVTVWPIFVLHGNGDVYYVKVPLRGERVQSASKILGPLTMFPPSEDNYGYDTCRLLCLHSSPPCVVIATTSGVIYHCIVLDDSNGGERPEPDWTIESSDVNGPTLYVFESVELPITLCEENDDALTQPIRLYKDITSQNKYQCTHASGLHSVAVPFLKSIEKCTEIGSMENLFEEESKQVSIVEHILCTKPLFQMESIPVLGIDVAVSDSGITMVCLLANWEFMCLPLVTSYFSSPPMLLSDDNAGNSRNNSLVIPAFEQEIEKTLQRSVCCPYLKSSNLVDSPPQQWLELLCSVTQRFREDYLYKLNTTQALLKSRIKVLLQQKEYQLKDMGRTIQEMDALRDRSDILAEKYNRASAKQDILMKRIESVAQRIQQHLPHLTKAEINMKKDLLAKEDRLQHLENSLGLIQKKVHHHQDKIAETASAVAAEKKGTLSDNQTKHIKELLVQDGDMISELKKTLLSLKKEIGV